jgi:hypothetical protein
VAGDQPGISRLTGHICQQVTTARTAAAMLHPDDLVEDELS